MEWSDWKIEVLKVSLEGYAGREDPRIVQELTNFNNILTILSFENIKGIWSGLLYVVSFSHKKISLAGHVPVPTFNTRVPGDLR